MEEYFEGKIHKSEPEPGNGNVNTVYFVTQARGNARISRTESVYTMNEHAITNVYSVIYNIQIIQYKYFISHFLIHDSRKKKDIYG